jgi:hypothetical protein
MSEKSRTGLGIKGAQTLPAARIDGSNIAEAVQKLCDLLGAARLGRESERSVYVCGVLLRNVDDELKDLRERLEKLEKLENKTEAMGDG